jgi:chloramphenicol-sensitive protein RarD
MKNKGIWFAFGAYVIWGLFPLYWKQFANVPALQLIGHRIIWSFLFLIGVVLYTKQFQAFRSEAFRKRAFGLYSIAALLSANGSLVWALIQVIS